MNNLTIATALNDSVRVLVINSTKLVEKARDIHNLAPTSAAALGRVLSASALMGASLKDEDEKISILINGGGPIGSVVSEANGKNEVKGFVSNRDLHINYEDTKKLAVGVAVGNKGTLRVTRNMKLKTTFSSEVVLQSGEIGDDFSFYFLISEQTPTVVSVGVLIDTDTTVKASGGMFIQLLPFAGDDIIEKVENISKTMKPISNLIDEGLSNKEIIDLYFDDAKVLEEKEVIYKCDCDKDKFKAGLSTLPIEDLESMIEEDNGAEITCEFCNKKYQFSKEELESIVEFKKSAFI